MTKLNLGCGNVKLDGFINIDQSSDADLVHDLTKKLPFDDFSVDFIFSEHFIEHITFSQAQSLLKECFRVMKLGAYIRISTPNLDIVIDDYLKNWKKQKWLVNFPEINTACKYINASFYGFGHKYVYNFSELRQQILDAGFIFYGEPSQSKYANDPMAYEKRPDKSLILMGVK